MVAERYGTKHHELIVTAEDAVKQLPKLLWNMDEPIGDSAVLPSFLVSKLAASNVKVALSGLGGDELFGGYDRYMPTKSKLERLSFIPKSVFKGLVPLLSNIIPSYRNQVGNLMLTDAERYHNRVKQMNWETIASLTGEKNDKQWFGADVIKKINNYPNKDEVNQRMFADIQLYMNDQLLHLTDRMSMAASLETRVPLLDHRLVELSLTIPSQFKINTTETKMILKESIKDLLPKEILYRPKWGFAAPYKTWTLTNAMQELINQTIEGHLVSDGILDRKGVQEFLGNKEMIIKYSTWVWPIIALELWYSNYRKI
jgi:asparagine synthase (glutamine-hydrolysing)